MTKTVIICGHLFDGLSDALLGPKEVLIEDGTIAEVSGSVGRPGNAKVLDLSARTVSPGFIDTHVHLCVDGLNLARQTIQCSPSKHSLAYIMRSNICATASQPFGTWARSTRNGRPSICVTPSTTVWRAGRV